jgi:hypothetical protein
MGRAESVTRKFIQVHYKVPLGDISALTKAIQTRGWTSNTDGYDTETSLGFTQAFASESEFESELASLKVLLGNRANPIEHGTVTERSISLGLGTTSLSA